MGGVLGVLSQNPLGQVSRRSRGTAGQKPGWHNGEAATVMPRELKLIPTEIKLV